MHSRQSYSGNNKGEVNHIRRIVLACERDMEVDSGTIGQLGRAPGVLRFSETLNLWNKTSDFNSNHHKQHKRPWNSKKSIINS